MPRSWPPSHGRSTPTSTSSRSTRRRATRLGARPPRGCGRSGTAWRASASTPPCGTTGGPTSTPPAASSPPGPAPPRPGLFRRAQRGNLPTMSTNALDGAVLDGTPPPVLTGPDVSTESEDKLEADPGFEIPDVSGVEPGAQVAVLREALLEAVYFDTADLRLARNSGITLRYRRDRSPGSTDEGTWTLKLPEDATGTGDRALI